MKITIEQDKYCHECGEPLRDTEEKRQAEINLENSTW